MNTAIFLKINKSYEIQDFVDLCNTKPYGIKAYSGTAVVNCKSLVGMFAIDTTKPFKVVFSVGQSFEECESFKRWRVQGEY